MKPAPRALLVVALLTCRPAAAVEFKLPGENRSVRLGLSQTLIGEYHTDVNAFGGDDSPRYFDLKNRTGLVLQHGSTSFTIRFDAHLFSGVPDEPYNNIVYSNQYSLEKIALSSTQRSFEITAGDFGVRVGRGLALDLTRVDELVRDTTLRGGQFRLTTRHVDGQVFGGWVNPLATDDFTEATVRIPSDVIGGGRVEVRPVPALALGLHYTGGGLESRTLRTRDAVHIIGGSVELPSLVDRLSLYAEYDFMRTAQDADVLSGHGAYLNATANLGPVALLLEFKYYSHFRFINTFGDNEWDVQIYHRPPTLMWSKQEILNNHDVIGPRLRLDYRIERWGSTVWASYGHFYRSDAAPDVGFFDSGAQINDAFGGLQQTLRGGALDLTGGYRLDTLTLTHDGQSITDYSQAFAELELSLAVWRNHSVEAELLYRKVTKSAEDFSEIRLSLGYRPSRWFAGSVSYEYSNEITDSDPTDDITVRNHFGGVTGTFNFTPSSSARLFGGTTQGGVRCIDGFCRQAPPFMGVRLEVVLQL